MTALSDREIRDALAHQGLVIDGLRAEAIQPASVDLHLGRRFAVLVGDPAWEVIDPARGALTRQVEVPEDHDGFLLEPGQFALGHTVETITVPCTLVGRYENKSSLARLGLATHFAGLIDPGFRGQVTLEFANLSGYPILLRPGMAIGQLSLARLGVPVARGYGVRGHYQDQDGPTPSRVQDQLAELGIG